MAIDGGHHHALGGLVSAALGGIASVSMPSESPWLRFGVGVATTVVGWLVTQLLSHALATWRGKRK